MHFRKWGRVYFPLLKQGCSARVAACYDGSGKMILCGGIEFRGGRAYVLVPETIKPTMAECKLYVINKLEAVAVIMPH